MCTKEEDIEYLILWSNSKGRKCLGLLKTCWGHRVLLGISMHGTTVYFYIGAAGLRLKSNLFWSFSREQFLSLHRYLFSQQRFFLYFFYWECAQRKKTLNIWFCDRIVKVESAWVCWKIVEAIEYCSESLCMGLQFIFTLELQDCDWSLIYFDISRGRFLSLHGLLFLQQCFCLFL